MTLIQLKIVIIQASLIDRCVTPFHAANQQGFKPTFNELDLVGLVVHVVQQQTKGPFQTTILSDGIRPY